MSTHVIQQSQDSDELRALIDANLPGRLTNVTTNGQAAGQVAFVMTPDLSAAETTTFGDLVAIANTPMTLQPSDWVVIKAQYPTVKAFVTNANPTNADVIAAVKAIARVLGALLRQ